MRHIDGVSGEVLVGRRLLLESKSFKRLLPMHSKQLLTCLRWSTKPVELHLNSGGATLKDGVRRVVNDYNPSASPFSAPRLRVNKPPSGE